MKATWHVSLHEGNECEVRIIAFHLHFDGEVRIISLHLHFEGEVMIISLHKGNEGEVRTISRHLHFEGEVRIISLHLDFEGEVRIISLHLHFLKEMSMREIMKVSFPGNRPKRVGRGPLPPSPKLRHPTTTFVTPRCLQWQPLLMDPRS